MRRFDAIVIGAGQAGPSLAGRLTQAGMSVAVVERHWLGGTCVNTGCMPTKTLVASAYAARLARRGSDYGIVIPGEVHIDMARVKARADAVIHDARAGLERLFQSMDGCTVVRGHARFEDPQTIRVGEESLSAPRIFINVGGRALIPDLPGIHDVKVLTNSSILGLDRVPEHLVVIGGSYIGLEFAQMYRRFGAEVTVIERGPRLIAREDEDISAMVQDIFVDEGITVHTGSTCIRVAAHPSGAEVEAAGDQGTSTVVGSDLLIAVGRVPNTDDLGLEHAGVATDHRGTIIVDDALSTNVPGIWALGDCNGRGAFTHTAYNDYEIVAANLLDGAERKVGDRIPGYALYIDPPLGRVGMTEAQARASGRPLKIGTRPMTRVGRAIEKGETQGIMKIIVDAQTERILGATILGPGGDEAIHGVLDMMNADVPYPKLQWAVPIHPTVSELIPTVLGEMVSV